MASQPAERQYANDAILSVAEAASYLRVHPEFVRRLCNLPGEDPARIPNLRLGRLIRVPYWSLVSWATRRSGSDMMPPSPREIARH